MTLKEQALAYAKQGLPVFPCRFDKAPSIPKSIGGRGCHDATTDLAKVSAFWDEYPDANIGCHVGDAGLMVVDFDPGSDEVKFASDFRLPKSTRTCNTPRDGLHEYYRVDEAVPPSGSKLAPYVDIRSKGSYVLLPPSATADGSYTWVDENEKIADAPSGLVAACLAPKNTKVDNPKQINVAEDQDENISAFIDWLRTDAKIPVVGQRNNTLAATAAMGHSYALSTEKTLDLIRAFWNPRLAEPIEERELEISGISGHRSATSAQGNMTKDYHRAPVSSLFSDTREGATDGRFRIIDRESMESIEPPEWLIHNMLAKETYVMLFGAPGSYKTFLALDLALAIAAEHDTWMDGRIISGGEATLFVAGEGRASLTNRVRAWEHAKNEGTRVPNFFLADPVPLVSQGFDQFIAVAKSLRPYYELIVLDTVSRALAGQNENSQETASSLTLQIDALRKEFGCTVLALHHTGHQGIDRERGSSVFRADADTVFSMAHSQLSMVKQKDAENWDKPIPLKAVATLDSMTLSLENTMIASARDIARAPVGKINEARAEAAALSNDDLATRLLGMMPVGKRYSRNQAAEFLSGIEPQGLTLNTWRKYLAVLQAFDTKSRDFYDTTTSQWVNKGR